MTSRNAARSDVGASAPPLNDDDIFDLHQRVAGAFVCLWGLQRLMEVENLEPNALEPVLAVLMPARDRLDELVKVAKEGAS